MSTMTSVAPVAEERRPTFLPELFGPSRMLVAENMVYAMMNSLSPLDYAGGHWDFYELGGRPLFMAPTSKARYRMACSGNGWQGEVSAEAAGIIATLFAFSHLSFHHAADQLVEGYVRLYEFAGDHPEAAEIFQAID